MDASHQTLFAAAGDLRIRRAEKADLEAVMGVLGQAAAWLAAKGVDQWPSPPNEHWRRRAAGYIEAGEIYLAELAGRPVATLRLAWSDAYWPDDSRAGYIHSLALADSLHGMGVGGVLLEWAEGRIWERGKAVARLDCAAENERLRRYYEERGYVYRGGVSDRDYLGALYEKELA